MLVQEFLERQKRENHTAAIGFFMDLLALLDEFAEERCSVLAGKIRGRLDPERFNNIQKTIESLKSLGLPETVIEDLESWLEKEKSDCR